MDTSEVLIVSADERVRSAVEQIMRTEGQPFASAVSAAGCLSYLSAHAPGCVLLDLVLADTNGLELQERLARASPPIVFVTRQADIPTSVQAIKGGAQDFLALPLEPQSLVRAVASAVAAGAAARARWQQAAGLRLRAEKLTPCEREVLTLLPKGLICKQIAGRLGISEITAQVHRRHVMQKMGAASIADLVHCAQMLDLHSAPVSEWRIATPMARSHCVSSHIDVERKMGRIMAERGSWVDLLR